MRYFFILNILFFSILSNVSAQSKAKLSGFVQDAANESLQSISVYLLKAKDSSLIWENIQQQQRCHSIATERQAEQDKGWLLAKLTVFSCT